MAHNSACQQCGGSVVAKSRRRKYCSERCKQAAKRDREQLQADADEGRMDMAELFFAARCPPDKLYRFLWTEGYIDDRPGWSKRTNAEWRDMDNADWQALSDALSMFLTGYLEDKEATTDIAWRMGFAKRRLQKVTANRRRREKDDNPTRPEQLFDNADMEGITVTDRNH